MTDEFEVRTANNRAERARALLADPMVAEALETIKTAVRDQIFDLGIEQREQREFLFMVDKARQQFETCFKALMYGAEILNAEYSQQAQMEARMEAIIQKGRDR